MNPIVRTMAAYAGARALPALMSFVFTLVCVQSLTAAEYGTYSLTLLPVTMGASFAGGLAGQPMLRFGSELARAERRVGLGRVPLLVAAIALPLLAIYLYAAGRSAAAFAVSVALVPLTAVLDTRRNYFVAMSRASRVFGLDAVRSVSSVVLLLLLIGQGFATSWVPLAAMLSAAALSLLTVSARADTESEEGDRRIDAAYLRYGFWVACWMAVIALMPLMERMLLESRFSVSDAGRYSAIADPISTAMSAAGGVVASALMPRFVDAWNRASAASLRRLTITSLGAVVGAALLCLAAGAVIVALDWGRWAGLLHTNVALSLLLLAGIALWQAAVFVHKPLELRAKTSVMFGCLVGAALVFLLCAGPLIARWGAEGVAVAKLLAGVAYISLVMVFRHGAKAA